MIMTVNAEYFNLNLAPAVQAFSVFAVSRRGFFYGRGGESKAVAGAYGNSRPLWEMTE